jgi:hypothetical protein
MYQLEGHGVSFVSSLQFDSQKLIFAAVHSPPNHYFWQNHKDKNPFRSLLLPDPPRRVSNFWERGRAKQVSNAARVERAHF